MRRMILKRTFWILGGLLFFLLVSVFLRMLFPVQLAGTTWEGTNDKGEHYEIVFGPEEYGPFNLVSPTQSVNGFQWWYYGPGDYFCFILEVPLALGFTPLGFTLRYDVFNQTLVPEDFKPFVLGLDLKRILGDAFHGAANDGLDSIDCGGQIVEANIGFYPDEDECRQQLKIWERWDINQVHQHLMPLPTGLGSDGFMLPSSGPQSLISYTFMRRNVIICMPEGEIGTIPQADAQVLKTAHLLDDAIANEAPSVYVIDMPKAFHRRQ